jgi:hypothetical protein
MKRCVLTLALTLLMASVAGAFPISSAYLMISGGPNSEIAGFDGSNSVLIVPVPDYVPGTVISLDPTLIDGFDDAWAGDSQVWFLGGVLPDYSEEFSESFSMKSEFEFDETILFLSQLEPQEISLAKKLEFLDALGRLRDRDWIESEGHEPFALSWENYAGDVFDGLGITFSTPGTLHVPSGLDEGNVAISFSLSAPSTEVDIIEHSPPNGLPILLSLTTGDGGKITGLTAHVLPEPGSIALFVAGLGALGFAIRRRRRR